MRRLTKPLWILLALVFLLEAWLWDHVRPLIARLVVLIAWPALRARIAAAIARLPPYPTLLVFLVPVLLLLPLKLLGVWMFAHGHLVGGIAVLALAKVTSVGATAFVFDVTRPKLMQLAWFRRLSDLVLRGLAWAHALIDPVKAELRAWAAHTIAPAMRRLRRLARRLRAGGRSGLVGRMLRLRRRLRRHGQPKTAR
ncbi:hypothetical protein RHODGE_RHODGE_01789 [Rhodoplanes serenus]|uniref:Transmembrane protein n=1 Tax=Rhodoplanes serenus TaxID=200615 RepID=A0A3S4B0B6_9BRAD|nr:hypothetical protein [Rhodoplanes serenus]VCU08624.1 hypothetical protein RHODGE_RHODGE_01789 [Rhodoplanes serenus]